MDALVRAPGAKSVSEQMTFGIPHFRSVGMVARAFDGPTAAWYGYVVRFEETFTVGRPPEVVFAYVTDPSNLADWQTAHTTTEQLADGPPRLGSRFRERLKPPLSREFEQVTEFTQFDRRRLLRVHIVEGPFPVDGTWSFERDGPATRVHFVADGRLRG